MTAIAAAPKATTWKLDSTHSHVEFAVKHLMIATVKGSFSGIEATIAGDDATQAGATITAKIETATISTKNDQRDAHLRSADFFDADKFPEMTFASKRIVGDTAGEFQVVGDLTLHGATKEITLDVTFEGQVKDPWGGTRIGYSAKAKIRRSDFGLVWNQLIEAGGVAVGEEIKISIDAEFVRS